MEREPLLTFSYYLSGRVNVLIDLEDEILALLDDGFTDEAVYGGKIGRASTLMWLWTLGACKVIRTICQANSYFSQPAQKKFKDLKKTLSIVRMPAAKMEKPGKKLP